LRALEKEEFMKAIKKILAPTDLSELSKKGLRYAMELAILQGAEVIVYHVIDVAEDWRTRADDPALLTGFIDEHKKQLARFMEANFADLSAKVATHQELELGRSYTNIVEKAADEKVDLIVMSTHGRTGLAHMMMGSVTEKVVGRAGCPVLSVPARSGAAPRESEKAV
jgi:nucleotide-binding universal stress UspA family protein